jgi:colanic acid/amylovoran biosynthesis glycosyltransferase
MDLFLFTNFFPFKKAEPFLVNEFEFAKNSFNHISIQALYGVPKDQVLAHDPGITIVSPLLAGPANKKELFLKGIFNLAPVHFHLREFFSEKIFLSPKKTYWFIVSCLITRLALSSRSYKQLVKAINSSKEPVLYFYWGDNLCWTIPYLRQQIGKAKIVVRFHGSDLYEELKGNYAPIRPQVLKFSDLLVPVSEYGKHYMEKKYAAFAHKIVLSRLGVFDHSLNRPVESGVKQVVSVANVVAVKRVHLIFEALQHTHSKIVWHHFGDGPLLEELKRLVQQKREGLEIILHGFVGNKAVMEFYKTQPVDVFMNVSASEGLPVAVMEALSFGIPVIATNVGGTSELVDSSTGRLIDKNTNAMALGAETESFLSIPTEERNTLRINARKRFETNVNAEVNYRRFYELLAQA